MPAAVRRIEDAVLPREAAEAVAASAREAGGADRDALAAKVDLTALEAGMTWRIVGLAGATNGVLDRLPRSGGRRPRDTGLPRHRISEGANPARYAVLLYDYMSQRRLLRVRPKLSCKRGGRGTFQLRF